MLTRRLVLGAAFLAGAGLCALAQDGSKVELKVRPAADAVVPYRVALTIVQSMEMMGQPHETKIERTEEFDCKVLSVEPDGSVKLEVKYGAIKGKMDVPMMGEVAFDSTKPDDPDVNPMIAPTLKSMTEKAGKTYPITVSAQGEVTSGDTKAVGRHPVFLFPLPKGPVDVGGAWEAVRERSMGQRKAFARGKCTLARSEGGVAELSFAGNLEEEAAKKDEAKKDAEKKDEAKKEAAAEEGGDDPSKSISAPKGTLKTAMKLDVATGMAVESTDETDLKITMPNPQTGESLDITVKAKSKLERRKPEAPKAGEEKK